MAFASGKVSKGNIDKGFAIYNNTNTYLIYPGLNGLNRRNRGIYEIFFDFSREHATNCTSQEEKKHVLFDAIKRNIPATTKNGEKKTKKYIVGTPPPLSLLPRNPLQQKSIPNTKVNTMKSNEIFEAIRIYMDFTLYTICCTSRTERKLKEKNGKIRSTVLINVVSYFPCAVFSFYLWSI